MSTIERGFKEKLSTEALAELQERARLARGDVLKMTTIAGCGHPGGSLSSMDFYTVLYGCANIDPAAPRKADRDRIVVSHGHTSPGVYAALGHAGFFDPNLATATFRRIGSVFEGHVERQVPGIDWSSGNLGQGLAAGCGFALSARLLKRDYNVFVAMSDGEQSKGQIAEARRLACRHDLGNITVIIDYNRLQLSGSMDKILPQNIEECYRADGWVVMGVDGHDIEAIHESIRDAIAQKGPVCIMAHTVMGKGVPFIEDDFNYHGKALSREDCAKALGCLGLEDDIDALDRSASTEHVVIETKPPTVKVATATPRTYGADERIDNRSAWGNAILDLGTAAAEEGTAPVAVLDCDLMGSVKTSGFLKKHPEHFFQVGIQEHTAATVCGAMSVDEVVAFFADFGVFGVDETFNQHRLNDINEASAKICCTHVGLDVGEDGKTHQCIDYVGAMRNLYGYRVIVPADGNQTDRAVRFAAATPGNYLIAMGRSKLPTIVGEDGQPLFAGDYEFAYGACDLVRRGSAAAILTAGGMVYRAVEAAEMLKADGIDAMVLNVPCQSEVAYEAIADAAGTGVVVTYEDHNVRTGLGTVVGQALLAHGYAGSFRAMGVGSYGTSGTPDELFADQGLAPSDLAAAVKDLV